MAEKVAISIVNYNMPEATDKIVEFLRAKIKYIDYFINVIDNGSKPEFISKYTTLRLEKNLNKLGGWLEAFKKSKEQNPTSYWTISTSNEFNSIDVDPLLTLIYYLRTVRDAVGITPGLTGELKDKPHQLMKALPVHNYHKSNLGLYALYDAGWLENEGYPDERLTSSWGTDYEMSYKARINGKKLLVSDLVTVKVTEAGVYRAGRADISETEYHTKSRQEMESVLTEKYGSDWKRVLGVEHYA